MFKLKINLGLLSVTAIVIPVCYAEVVVPTTLSGNSRVVATQPTALSSPTKSDSNLVAMGALLNKAHYWKVNGRMDLAANTWARVLKSNPEQEEALAGMALYQATMGSAANADIYLAKLRKINPQHPVLGEVAAIFSPQTSAAIEKELPTDASVAASSAAGLDVKLASRHLVQGNLHAAEIAYVRALKVSPHFPDALLGLANVMLIQKQFDDVLLYVDRYDQRYKPTSVSKRLRSVAYSGKGKLAEDAGEVALAEKHYSQAYSANPGEPWVSLSLARVLRKQGDAAAAYALIEKMAEGVYSRDKNFAVTSFYSEERQYIRDKNFAASIFYSEENQWVQVLVLLDQIPEPDRAGAIKELHSRAVVYVKSDLAKKLYSEKAEADSIKVLSAVENDAEGKPELVSVAVSAWMDIKQPEQAVALLEHNVPLAPSLLPQYAGLLLQTGQDAKLQHLFEEMDAKDSKYAHLKDPLDNIRIALCVRQADSFRESGNVVQRINVLSPMLRKYPQDINLLLAQGRLLADEGYFPAAMKNADIVLVSEPSNREALRQALVAAIRMKNYSQAERYLNAAKAQDRRGLYLEAGYTAEVVNNNEQAAVYFAVARMGDARLDHVDVLASPEMQFAGGGVQHARYIDFGYAMRRRSGTNGLGLLRENEIPIALHIPLKDKQSSIVFKAADVKLDAGDAGLVLDQFGTNLPAIPVAIPYPMQAHGLAVSAGYQSTAFSADLGVSPVGFLFNDVVGGLRWNHDVANANVAIEGTRRSVTESLLSYAGVKDNVTGKAWGGVSKTGAQVSVYYPFVGSWAGYVSAGLYDYSGHNTANNTSSHLNTSIIYELMRTDDFEASISVRLSRARFNNNQNYFYWGHGGYYSPQRDTSLSIPLRVSGKTQRFGYELNLSASVANTVESPAQIYPTDAVLQAGLGAAGTTLGVNAQGKASRHADWVLEYALTPQLALGNRFHFDEAPKYQQIGGMLYIRYDFESGRKIAIPTNALRPYYLTTQGGAGLN